MALYSETIHKKIDEKIKEAKELFKSSEPISLEEKETKFNELVELFKEKYGDSYLSYITSFFLEPALFVKVTDTYRETHQQEEDEEEDEEEEEEEDEEEEEEEEEEEDEEEEEEDEEEEEECDVCDIAEQREDEESNSDNDLDAEEKFRAMFEKLSGTLEEGEDEKKFLENLLNYKGEDASEEGEEEEDASEEDEEEEDEEEEEEEDEEEEEEGDEEEKANVQEYIENIMDVVPVQEVSFMMMMLFGLDKDEEEKFTAVIKENEEKNYTIQQNPYYLNNQKAKFNKFIYKQICKLSKEAGKNANAVEDNESESESENVQLVENDIKVENFENLD